MEMVDERVSAVDRGAPTTLHELKERGSRGEREREGVEGRRGRERTVSRQHVLKT